MRITRVPATLPRVTLPGWPLFLCTVLALVLTTSGLLAASASVPELAPTVSVEHDDIIAVEVPRWVIARQRKWAGISGKWGECLGPIEPDARFGNREAAQDCRDMLLPQCPRNVQPLRPEALLKQREDIIPEVLVEGLLTMTRENSIVLTPVSRKRANPEHPKALRVFELDDSCVTPVLGHRVLVRGFVENRGLHFIEMCSVIP